MGQGWVGPDGPNGFAFLRKGRALACPRWSVSVLQDPRDSANNPVHLAP